MRLKILLEQPTVTVGDMYDLVRKVKVAPNGVRREKWHGALSCSSSAINSLEGSPRIVDSFYCNNTFIKTLEGGPEVVHGKYWCTNSKLTSLKGAPKEVEGSFDCSWNDLPSLVGGPTEVHGNFIANANELTSLEGAPKITKGSLYVNDNRLSSLKNVHQLIKEVDGILFAHNNSIMSHVLGVLLIKSCSEIDLDLKGVAEILNRYLPNREGMKGLLRCQRELIEAGFEEEAQL